MQRAPHPATGLNWETYYTFGKFNNILVEKVEFHEKNCANIWFINSPNQWIRSHSYVLSNIIECSLIEKKEIRLLLHFNLFFWNRVSSCQPCNSFLEGSKMFLGLCITMKKIKTIILPIDDLQLIFGHYVEKKFHSTVLHMFIRFHHIYYFWNLEIYDVYSIVIF